MSFLHYMMGRGLRRAAALAQGSEGLLSILLERGHMSPAQGDLMAAQLAFEAERRGELSAAAARYESVVPLRFAPRWALERAACVWTVTRDTAKAIDVYRTLARNGPATALLILGELLLSTGDAAGAAETFRRGLGKLTRTADESRGGQETDPIHRALTGATEFLRCGRYVRARESLEEALRRVDLFLMAQGAWIVAEARAGNTEVGPNALLPAVGLADTLLRYLARASLASSLADVLRKRCLREDLAVWATGADEVTALLAAERQRLERIAGQRPNHAEIFYRLGLICRALGDLPAAARALRRVLAIQPHYTRAAVRLAATLDQLHQSADSTEVLAKSCLSEGSTLRGIYRLGLASVDARQFDRAAQTIASPHTDARANLALALGEMGLLDETRREWKEVALQPG